jgi:RHS repeat-associated protein
VAQEREGEFTWIHADHLSSATRITDAAGLEIRRLAYAAFGEETENQGTGDDPKYTYTGKEQDSTGLYYYGARYYDPALARFISADTVYDVGPQGLNRYSYALNNPILYRDPMGHSTYTEVIDVLTFGGGGVAVWQAVKEGVIALIPSPGVVAGGVLGAIPLILHAKNVGEGSDVIPLPATPVDATPAEPDDGPPTEPDDPKGPGRRPPFPHSKKGDEAGPTGVLAELRAPARKLLQNEGVLIDESLGLQSHSKGLFKNVVKGEHGELGSKYLWTVDERGINIALETTPFPTPRGNIVHSNISSKASIAGEAWFISDNEVIINAGSGRFGYGSATPEQWEAAVKYWEELGYQVEAIPFDQR